MLLNNSPGNCIKINPQTVEAGQRTWDKTAAPIWESPKVVWVCPLHTLLFHGSCRPNRNIFMCLYPDWFKISILEQTFSGLEIQHILHCHLTRSLNDSKNTEAIKGKLTKQEQESSWKPHDPVELDPETSLVILQKGFSHLEQKELSELSSQHGTSWVFNQGGRAQASPAPLAWLEPHFLPPLGGDIFVRWGTFKNCF